jgi:plasmid stabilization system protein ParE
LKPRVRFDEEADAEYRLAGRWYDARRAHLGVEFFDAVDATIGQIAAMPRAGTRIPRLPADLIVRRRAVARFPYHVVYLEMATHIRVLAVAHDRRKPGYWRKRL